MKQKNESNETSARALKVNESNETSARALEQEELENVNGGVQKFRHR